MKNKIMNDCFYSPPNMVNMSSTKYSGCMDDIFVNQLENNDTLGKNESAAYSCHITFDGNCHSTKDLLN